MVTPILYMYANSMLLVDNRLQYFDLDALISLYSPLVFSIRD